MHLFLEIIQIIAFLGTLGFVLLISREKSSELVKIMLCIGYSAIIMNAGYLIELTAKLKGSAMAAVRIEYVGSAFVATFILLFVCQYCRVQIPAKLKYVLLIIGCPVLISVWLSDYTNIYYTSVDFVDSGFGPHLELGQGSLYILFAIVRYGEILVCLVISFASMRKTKDRMMKHKYFMIFAGILFSLLFPLLFSSEIYSGYDPMPCSVALGTILFGVTIAVNKTFDVVDVAHEAVFGNMDTGIIVVNNQLEFEEANPKAIEIFPYLKRFQSGAQIQETDFFDLFSDQETKEYITEDCIYEVHINDIWTQGQVVGQTAVFIDVTDKKRQIEEMRELQEQAEVANKAKSRFLANMSHEIRTPINAIMGMNEMILREGMQDDIKQYATDVKNSANALLNIVNDVLDFSKIESGKLEIIPVEYDICSMLNDLMNMISVRARAKNLQFDVQVSPDIPTVLYGDDIRLRQILINLLTNAVKYTEKGTVTLRVSGTKSNNMETLHFEIEDTGIGISKEDLPKLYSAFERIEEKKNRSIEGTGLGLNITINLLELMGSRLNVESEFRKGSIFSFDLPQRILNDEVIGDFEKRIEQQIPDCVSCNDYVAPEARVLVIDDNEFNRKVFRNLLKRTRIQVTDLESGKECLERIKKEHFDLIFLDHMMPEMDGVETFQKMQQMEHVCKDTPVIMLTANAIMGAREQYLEYGFNAFLSKPIDSARLEKLIGDMLPEELLQKADTLNAEASGIMGEKLKNDSDTNVELPEIDGLDWKHAGLFFANQQDTLDAVVDFTKSLEREKRIIMEAYDGILDSNENSESALDTYRIHVHSMKSASAMTGNLTLSALAKCLESMAKQEDLEGIRRLHGVFEKELSDVEEKLSVLLPQQDDEQERERISKESLCSMLDLLNLHMEELDVDSADNLMQVLSGYFYDDKTEEYMILLKDAVDNLDIEETAAVVEKIKGQVI